MQAISKKNLKLESSQNIEYIYQDIALIHRLMVTFVRVCEVIRYFSHRYTNSTCHHHNLVDLYEVSISQMTMDLLIFTYGFFPLSMPRVLPDLIVCMSNTTGVL